MSDAEVLRLIEEMEALLKSDASSLDSEQISGWHQRFLAACASTEKGPDWPKVVQRAHAISGQVESLVTTLSLQRDALKQEMETQAVGKRALKAYKPVRP